MGRTAGVGLVGGTDGGRLNRIGCRACVLLALLSAATACPAGDADPGDSAATAVVERRAFAASVTALGAVRPRVGAEVKVGSRISGRVRRLRANIGDRVQRGQVLAELETEELDARVAERRAELAQAGADLQGQQASATLAAAEWARIQPLLRQRAVPEAEADVARERDQVARAQLESARRARERAEAALLSARVERSFAVITAPISGNVASVATQEGETVAAGLSAPTFLTIVDLARLQVNAFVDEVDIGQVEVGQPAEFSVDAFPARTFAGKVHAIYPSATIQDNVVKYVVAVDITSDYTGALRPEMTASVRIGLPARTVLAIPARAVRRDRGGSMVHVLEEGGPTRRPVRVGWRDGPWIEIVSGLAAGERVLLDPPAPPPESRP